MKVKQFFACGVIVLLSATATGLGAADVEVKGNADLPKSETRVKTDREVDTTVRTDLDHAKLRHWNKASGLLGMEVRNRESQKLGEIKDLVMESPGKVS